MIYAGPPKLTQYLGDDKLGLFVGPADIECPECVEQFSIEFELGDELDGVTLRFLGDRTQVRIGMNLGQQFALVLGGVQVHHHLVEGSQSVGNRPRILDLDNLI